MQVWCENAYHVIFCLCAYLVSYFSCLSLLSVARGFSLWRIWDDWLQATSVGDLLERILFTLEKGYSPTLQSMEEVGWSTTLICTQS